MPAVTLATLRQRVRARADMASSDFIPDTDLDTLINESVSGLYDILVSKFEDYYIATGALTLSGTSVALPANFYKLLRVEVQTGGRWYRLAPYTWEDMTHLRNVQGWPVEQTRFRLSANVLSTLPAVTSPTSATLTYIPQCPVLTAPTDTVEFLQGWEQWAVLDAAIKCLAKEESDTSALEREQAKLQGRIEVMAANRAPGEVQRVQDTYGSTAWDAGEPSTRWWR